MDDSSGIGIAVEVEGPATLKALERLLARADASYDGICAEVSHIFHVRPTEVALLCLRGNLLKFLFPPALKNVGTIPVSGSAIAARTAITKKPELFNSFTKVRHMGVFEAIKLDEGEAWPQAQVIQKLMSVPVADEKAKVWGVLQVSRKGTDGFAGPDFTRDELQLLVLTARMIGATVSKRS